MSSEDAVNRVDNELRNQEQREREKSGNNAGDQPKHHHQAAGLPDKTQNGGDVAERRESLPPPATKLRLPAHNAIPKLGTRSGSSPATSKLVTQVSVTPADTLSAAGSTPGK